MKTTIDIPEETLRETMRFAMAKTKREAVFTALAEFTHRRKVGEILNGFGAFKDFPTNEAIEAADSAEMRRESKTRKMAS